jgi:hypothetical protein
VPPRTLTLAITFGTTALIFTWVFIVTRPFHVYQKFYAPVWKDWGHIAFGLSVCKI